MNHHLPERTETLKVLLVEDNSGDARLTREALSEVAEPHLELTSVSTAAEGLAVIVRGETDALLLDLSLPDSYGLETFQRFLDAAPDLPIVVLSGAVDQSLAVQAVQLGAQDYLVKGAWDGDLMMRAVRYAIERKRAEKTLRESEEFFRLISESVTDMIAVIDRNGNRLYNSPSYAVILGDPRALFGSYSFQEIHPDDRDRVHEIFRKTVETGVGQRTEYRFLLPDGTIRYMESQGSVIKDEAGRTSKIVIVSRDITDRKQAEEVLKQRTMELIRSNAELEKFAYVASHDLQEPLRMVASYTQLLARRYKGKLDADADEIIAFAVDGARRMQGLINDLLAYSRIGSRTEPFKPTACEEVLASTLANLKLLIKETNATIQHDPLPTVVADATQMGQVFLNLIGNALKFRGDAPPVVQIKAQQQADEWLFSIQDNGIGIDPQYAERIFVIFQRLHDRTKYPGTGIGLAVCKKIVERHGGRIWMDSSPGQGTKFHFTIPQKPIETNAAK